MADKVRKTAKQILEEARERAQETLDVPIEEWGIDVTIRRLTTHEVLAMESLEKGEPFVKNLILKAVIEPLFEAAELDELFVNDGPGPITQIVLAITSFNKMNVGEEEAKKIANTFRPTDSK